MFNTLKKLLSGVARTLRPVRTRVSGTYGARTQALSRIQVQVADITTLPVDAIVNAANSSLLGGGGVDGAIHRAAGPELLAYCRTLGGCEAGDVKGSPGFDLAAKYVLHAVGPDCRVIKDPAEQDRLLESVYRKAMIQARALQSIAFPAISCGIYGFEPCRAARIAIRVIAEELETSAWQSVQLAAFDDSMARILNTELARQRIEASGKPVTGIAVSSAMA